MAFCLKIPVEQHSDHPHDNVVVDITPRNYKDIHPLATTKRLPLTLSLVQFSHTPDTTAKLVKHPEDRSVVVKKLIEQSGGHAGVLLTGGLTNLKTTVLISAEEAMKAMQIATGLTMPQPEG